MAVEHIQCQDFFLAINFSSYKNHWDFFHSDFFSTVYSQDLISVYSCFVIFLLQLVVLYFCNSNLFVYLTLRMEPAEGRLEFELGLDTHQLWSLKWVKKCLHWNHLLKLIWSSNSYLVDFPISKYLIGRSLINSWILQRFICVLCINHRVKFSLHLAAYNPI